MGGKFDRMRHFAERIIGFMRVRLDACGAGLRDAGLRDTVASRPLRGRDRCRRSDSALRARRRRA